MKTTKLTKKLLAIMLTLAIAVTIAPAVVLGSAEPASSGVGFREVSAGANHTMGIKTDGTLWAWGRNSWGQLGDGTVVQRSSPVQVGTDANWASVSAGVDHTMAIRTDGTLWGWGSNMQNQLGTGAGGHPRAPAQIGTANNWASVSAGQHHTMAVRTNGTLWGWGRNQDGELGDGTRSEHNIPTQIGTDTNWASVSAGRGYTMAIRTNGTLWGSGNNTSRQLGDGTSTDRFSFVQIGTATNWASVSAGSLLTAGIRTNGTIWIWGGPFISPEQIHTGNNWASVSAGHSHIMATQADGTLWGSRENGWGQLGDGTTEWRGWFVRIGTASNWVGVSAGGNHTVGVRATGSVWTWGRNTDGQLGDGTTIWRLVPTFIYGESATVTFNGNGGAPATQTTTLVVGTALENLLPENPTRANHRFAGWFDTSAASGGTQFTSASVIYRDTNLWARWIPTHPVTFNGNGITLPVNSRTRTVDSGPPLGNDFPPNPTRAGYRFVGWFNTNLSFGGTEFTAATIITANTALHARWEEASIVTFNANGGAPGISTQILGRWDDLAFPTVTRPGFRLVGWFNTPAATGGTEYRTWSIVREDITLWARWAPIFTVTFNGNGITLPANARTRTVNDRNNLSGNFPPNPTRAGHTFVGWYNTPAATGGTDFWALSTFTANTTLWARWRRITHSVSFSAIGANVLFQTRTVGHGDRVVPPTPVRSGYTFTGWYTSLTGGRRFNFNTPITSSNVWLWARFVRRPVRPANFRIARSGRRANITFRQQAGVRMQIQHSTNNGRTWRTVRNTAAGASRWRSANLRRGSRNAYRVRAFRTINGRRVNSRWTVVRRVNIPR